MLSFVDKLDEVDTKNIEPLLQINELYNKFRKDEVRALNAREDLLNNAPKEKDGQFAVPKVIDKKNGWIGG